jgi:glycosyltransferase involved in cell wall biosynthesis
MRRVLYIAYHFPPVGGGAVQRNVGFARHLARFGYTPVVITGPGGGDHYWAPEDEELGDSIHGGVEVHRVPGPTPPPIGRLRARVDRLLDRRGPWLDWWIEGAIEAGARVAPTCDLIFAGLEPYRTADAARAIAKLAGRPWVADLQDPWALDEMRTSMSALHHANDLRAMHRGLSSAAAIVMNVPEAAERVRRRFPDLADRVTPAVTNGFEREDFAGEAPTRDDDAFRIVHTGYLHTELGLRHRERRRLRRLIGGAYCDVDILTRSHYFLRQAVDRLIESDPSLAGSIEVHLAGVLNDTDRAIAEGADYFRMPGYLPHGSTVELIRSADLLFLPMQELAGGARAGLTPGKTYEYVASGRPILAAVPPGDARELLLAAGTGRICAPSDVEAMTTILRDEVAKWRRGESQPCLNEEVVAQYERLELTRRLAGIFDGVLAKTERRGVAPLEGAEEHGFAEMRKGTDSR